MNAPTRRYRTYRYGPDRTAYYKTKEARDKAAERDAAKDSADVLLDVWDEKHPQDEINQGWACDGVKRPPGYVAPVKVITEPMTSPHERPERTAYAVGFAAGYGSGRLRSQGTTVQAADNYLPMWVTTRELQDEWSAGFTAGFWHEEGEANAKP